jgi:hypothetical protein
VQYQIHIELDCRAMNIIRGIELATPTDTPTATATPTKKVVFVSSEKYTRDLGGLDGADAKCQQLAESAGLSGLYKAWLSDSASSPSTRFTHPLHPYVLVDGTIIANGWEDLTDGQLTAPINVTETGGSSGVVAVWTFTDTSGNYSTSDWWCGSVRCNNVGATNHKDQGWTYYAPYGIGWTLPLYCFQQ